MSEQNSQLTDSLLANTNWGRVVELWGLRYAGIEITRDVVADEACFFAVMQKCYPDFQNIVYFNAFTQYLRDQYATELGETQQFQQLLNGADDIDLSSEVCYKYMHGVRYNE